MQNEWERIAEEASAMDRRSQLMLVERLMQNLREQPEHMEFWSHEAKRRIEAYDRGEMDSIDHVEALGRVRKMFEE